MEIRQLKYFVGVVEAGCFSEASRRLYISQSAISQQIKLLEEELDTQLFTRHHNSLTLTESGETLLPLAKRVLRDMVECQDRINDLKGMLCGELNIGLTYTLEPYMREAMIEFMREYPKVQLNAHYKNLPELLKLIRNKEVDVMLSMMPTSPHDFVDSIPLMPYRLAAIMRKTHVLAKKESLTFQDLLPHKLILPEKGIRDRNAIESFVHKETGNLQVRALVNDANALLNILQETNYVSILTETTIANRPSLCSVPIVELTDPIQIYAHFNNTVNRKSSAKVFIDILHRLTKHRTLLQEE